MNPIRLKGTEQDGSVVYVVVKSTVVKMVNRQNEDIGFGHYMSDVAACRFALEDARDTPIDTALLAPGYTEHEVRAGRMVHIMHQHTNGIVWTVFGPDHTGTLYTSDDVFNIALQAVYLSIGYAQESGMGSKMPEFQEENGHVETMTRLIDLAKIVHKRMGMEPLKALAESGWPGVFEYEVTEGLGVWFAKNSKCSDEQFESALVGDITMWVSK